jgi:hypothetical protein
MNGSGGMGAILDLVNWVQTPIGAGVAIAALTAVYFYGRWVLKD